MKRLHVHVSVANLEESIGFYKALFDAEPSIRKPDYAKWMLDDPRVNFAISNRRSKAGLDHLGIQAESEAELAELQQRLERAAVPSDTEIGTSCCYSKSDKHWTVDPQGIAWESFHTLESIPTFNSAGAEEQSTGACCAPKATTIAFRSRL